MKATGEAQPQVDAIVAKLAYGEIGRIDIIQIPADVLTRTTITPAMLEKQYRYKLTIHDIREEPYRGEMVEAAKSITTQPRSQMPDLRWGVIFYGPNDARVGALYFDKWGTGGAVGDSPVSVSGRFFGWLSRNFSGCLP